MIISGLPAAKYKIRMLAHSGCGDTCYGFICNHHITCTHEQLIHIAANGSYAVAMWHTGVGDMLNASEVEWGQWDTLQAAVDAWESQKGCAPTAEQLNHALTSLTTILNELEEANEHERT